MYVCVYIYTHILYFLSYMYMRMMNIWTRTTQFRVSCSCRVEGFELKVWVFAGFSSGRSKPRP